MKKIIIIIVLCLFYISVFSQVKRGDDLIGKWFTENNEAKLEIYKTSEKYYGKIIWLKESIDKETSKPKKDKNNPDIKLRERPVIGMILMSGFIFNGKDEWENGSIYDAKSGKTYNCYISFESRDKIKVRGYIGKAWMGLGRTTIWTRTN